jgi:hypothetical protein
MSNSCQKRLSEQQNIGHGMMFLILELNAVTTGLFPFAGNT